MGVQNQACNGFVTPTGCLGKKLKTYSYEHIIVTKDVYRCNCSRLFPLWCQLVNSDCDKFIRLEKQNKKTKLELERFPLKKPKQITYLFLQILKVIPITFWFAVLVSKRQVHQCCDPSESPHTCNCLLNIHSSMLPKLLSHWHKSFLPIVCYKCQKLSFKDFYVSLQARDPWSLPWRIWIIKIKVFLRKHALINIYLSTRWSRLLLRVYWMVIGLERVLCFPFFNIVSNGTQVWWKIFVYDLILSKLPTWSLLRLKTLQLCLYNWNMKFWMDVTIKWKHVPLLR